MIQLDLLLERKMKILESSALTSIAVMFMFSDHVYSLVKPKTIKTTASMSSVAVNNLRIDWVPVPGTNSPSVMNPDSEPAYLSGAEKS